MKVLSGKTKNIMSLLKMNNKLSKNHKDRA